MNFYDPQKSYANIRNWSSRQIVEFQLDSNEFAMGKNDDFIAMQLIFPINKVRYLLEKCPEAFDDVEPQKEEEMDEEGKKLNKYFLERLKDKSSHEYRFAEWIENKRNK